MTEDKGKTQIRTSSLFGEKYKIEMYKGKNESAVMISAVLKIIEYDGTRVELLTRNGRINVNGSCLFVHTYDGRRVEIVGKIESILTP